MSTAIIGSASIGAASIGAASIGAATATGASAGTARSSARPRLRLTRRGRLVLTLLAAIPLLIGVALAVLNGGQASAGDTAAHVSFETVTVQPGESLWQVAEEQAPNADPRQVVQDIVDLNGLDGAGVQAGQRIAIPAAYVDAN